jgi:hypothetical protein
MYRFVAGEMTSFGDYDVPRPSVKSRAALANTSNDAPDYDVPRPFKSVFAGDELPSSKAQAPNAYEPEQRPPNFSVFDGEPLAGPAFTAPQSPGVDYDVPVPGSAFRRAPIFNEEDEDALSSIVGDEYDGDRSMASLGSAFSSVSLSAASFRRSLYLGEDSQSAVLGDSRGSFGASHGLCNHR